MIALARATQGAACCGDQLQRDLAIELRVARPKHLPEGAPAERLDDRQVAPAGRGHVPMNIGERRQDLEPIDESRRPPGAAESISAH